MLTPEDNIGVLTKQIKNTQIKKPNPETGKRDSIRQAIFDGFTIKTYTAYEILYEMTKVACIGTSKNKDGDVIYTLKRDILETHRGAVFDGVTIRLEKWKGRISNFMFGFLSEYKPDIFEYIKEEQPKISVEPADIKKFEDAYRKKLEIFKSEPQPLAAMKKLRASGAANILDEYMYIDSVMRGRPVSFASNIGDTRESALKLGINLYLKMAETPTRNTEYYDLGVFAGKHINSIGDVLDIEDIDERDIKVILDKRPETRKPQEVTFGGLSGDITYTINMTGEPLETGNKIVDALIESILTHTEDTVKSVDIISAAKAIYMASKQVPALYDAVVNKLTENGNLGEKQKAALNILNKNKLNRETQTVDEDMSTQDISATKRIIKNTINTKIIEIKQLDVDKFLNSEKARTLQQYAAAKLQ